MQPSGFLHKIDKLSGILSMQTPAYLLANRTDHILLGDAYEALGMGKSSVSSD